jgi:hypothetical protein
MQASDASRRETADVRRFDVIRDLTFVIPRCAIVHLRMRLFGAGPESILPVVVMDSGLAQTRAPE